MKGAGALSAGSGDDQAKALLRAETADSPELAKLTPALETYEAAVTGADGSVAAMFLSSPSPI